MPKKKYSFVELLKKYTTIDIKFIDTFFKNFKIGHDLEFNILDKDVINNKLLSENDKKDLEIEALKIQILKTMEDKLKSEKELDDKNIKNVLNEINIEVSSGGGFFNSIKNSIILLIDYEISNIGFYIYLIIIFLIYINNLSYQGFNLYKFLEESSGVNLIYFFWEFARITIRNYLIKDPTKITITKK